MEFKARTDTALLTALALAAEHGSAAEALRVTGLDLDERFDGLPDAVERMFYGRTPAEAMREALALGFLAGRVAHRPRPRRALDPSSFVMDHDLVVRGAEGESILRLPWFEEDLFVARQIPDISEMPTHVRKLCVANYSAGLKGERGRFDFISYGHAYTVEVVPVRGEDGSTKAVLGIAIPARAPTARLRAAASLERTAEAFDDAARLADYRAGLYRSAGHPEDETRERQAAERSRGIARRARTEAFRRRSSGPRD